MDDTVQTDKHGDQQASRWRGGMVRAFLVFVFCLLVAAVGLGLNHLNIAVVDTFDKTVGDWRIALGSPRAADQRSDIAIVLIGEETLRDYESRSPIDRGLLAELVTAIDAAGAKAIALDFIFDRRTRNDDRLIAAAKAATAPVVFGAIDQRVLNKNGSVPCEGLAIQTALLKAAGRPFGHLMLERKLGLLAASNDSPVRLIAGPAASGDLERVCGAAAVLPARDAFVDVIARAANITPKPDQRMISWQRSPANGYALFTTLEVPRHLPAQVRPGLSGIVTQAMKDSWKGRIVVIGADLIDQDQHLTPMSVIDGPTAGVAIHAQALAQRIDGNRDIVEWPLPINLALVAIVTLGCFVAARTRGIKPDGMLYGVAGLLLIGLASVLAFKLRMIEIPSIALATAWAAGGFGGFASEWLFGKLGLGQRGGTS